MAQPTTQLNATEQDTLVKQIGLALLRAAPRDWRRVTAQYRAVGRYHELTGEVLGEDGTVGEWMATHDIATLFGRLRAGMYREGRGTWFNARYQLDHPSSYNLEYDRDEPRWDLQPPPQAYADELRMFPRSEENVPEWLMRRMSGLGPEQPGPRFRIARIFDGQQPDGRPVLNRPELDSDELDRLYEYLNKAPVVLSERGLDLDRLASPPTPKVPVAFHTDGTWIWPAAINFYLHEYGVAPENELVTHIQQAGYRLPDVPEGIVQAANAHLTRGNQPPPPPRPPRMPQQDPPQAAQPPVPVQQEPESEAETAFEEQPDHAHDRQEAEEQQRPQAFEAATMFTPMPNLDDGPPTMIHSPVPHEREEEPDAYDDERSHAPESSHALETERSHALEPERSHALEPEPPSHAPEPAHAQEPEPPALPWNVQVSTTPPVSQAQPEPDEPVLDSLRERLQELDVPESAYRIGEPNEHGWSMEKVESGWRVGWYDDDLSNPAVFGDPEDAAAFMLGKLLLDPRGHETTPAQGAQGQGAPGTPGTPAQGASAASASLPVAPPPQQDDTVPVNGGPKADRVREEAGLRSAELPQHGGDLAQHGTRTEQELPQRGGELPQRGEPARAESAREPAQAGLRTEPASPPAGEPLARREPAAAAAAEPMARREPPSPPAGEPMPRREPPAGEPQARREPPASEPRADELDGAPTMLAAPVPPPAPRRDPAPQQQPLPRRGGERERPQQGGQQQAGGGGGQWPIQPMAGEPPLTLFRGKEMRELPAGSELDRFGGPNGNLLYAAGTPFEERSLVPEWVGRPYHVYRVQRPIDALAGVAIPWFNQPGGGAAYLLPASIEELLADGDLIELDPGEPPID